MKFRIFPVILILLILTLALASGCVTNGLTLPSHNSISYNGDAFAITNTGSGIWANGIVGSSESENGKGIYGRAGNNLENAANYGGYFEARGGKARAVYGEATNSGNGENYGGYFVSKGNGGFGVYGKNETRGYFGYLGGWHSGVEGKHIASGCKGVLGYRLYGVKGYHGQSHYSGYLGTENHGVRSEGPLLVKGGIRVENPEGSATAYPIMTIDGPSGWNADFWGKVVIRSRHSGDPVMELGEGLDYAEGFNVSNKCEIGPGSVLIIDPDNPGKLAISDKPYDSKVAGIISGAMGQGSGVRLGASHFDYDIALAGRVYCNVDTTYGEVSPGDLLTTSPTPGYAMAVRDYLKARGAILGKAMERLEKGQKGQIMVLVTLQ